MHTRCLTTVDRYMQKLLKGEIKTRGCKNVVQARSFAGMLEQTLVAIRTAPSKLPR
jgi:hypothetical protein